MPCNGVHTFGMRYPIDVVFLDENGTAVDIKRNLAPNRITGGVGSARSALEFESGVLAQGDIRIGDRLRVGVDEDHPVNWNGVRALLHWPMNFCVAMFWFLLLTASYHSWLATGQMSSLGLVLVNAVICFFFLTRRASVEISSRGADWVVAFLTVGLAMFLRPDSPASPVLDDIATPIKAVGLAGLLLSLISLGRSLGIVPANRGIKRSGPYRVLRHPVYASELVFLVGYLLSNASVRNLLLVVLVTAGQVYRLLAEERLLCGDQAYRSYVKAVRYRLLPGIF
jgi:protein-S-isoprenylcysteine O-methyltransferase Ste14